MNMRTEAGGGTRVERGRHLSVKVFSPKGVLWEGSAECVSSVNTQGPFDLLPRHAHFISLVEKQPIRVQYDQKEKIFTFESAVIRLLDDEVTIYVDVQ